MLISNDDIKNIFKIFDSALKLIKIEPLNSGLYNSVYKVITDPANRYNLVTFILRIAPPDNVPKLFYEKT